MAIHLPQLSKRKTKVIGLATVLVLFAGIASYFTFFSDAASPNGVLIYRGISNDGVDHYFTPLNYTLDPNFHIEGPAFWAFNENEPGTVRVTRWYNSNVRAHYLTIPGQNPGAADGSSGWLDDSANNGGTFNVYASPQPDNPHIVPVYLWYVANADYIYTTDGTNAPAPGWTNAGIQFYTADSDPATWEPLDAFYPDGYLDGATCQSVWGWTTDADSPNTPVTVHIYVDDQLVAGVVADQDSGDVGRHRFTYTFPTAYTGSHTVQAYGLSLNSEGAKGKDIQNALLKNGYRTMDMGPCETVTPPPPDSIDNTQPRGYLDGATCQMVRGWIIDDDNPTAVVTAHIYVDGQLIAGVPADQDSGDVGKHRFEYRFPTPYSGTHSVQVYGLSLGTDGNKGADTNNALLTNGDVSMDMGPCTSSTPPEQSDAIVPVGYLDAATCKSVWGWARDDDNSGAPVTVHIYIDNRSAFSVEANQDSSDVGKHRFEFTFPDSYNGTHTVQVYAISLNAGGTYGDFNKNVLLTNGDITMDMGPCAPVSTPEPTNNFDPEGFVDTVDCRVIQGWALDKDSIDATTSVHVYIDNATSPSIGVVTDQLRSDVNNTYKASANALHGYTVVLPDVYRTSGSHVVQLYALDLASNGQYSGGARNTLIGNVSYTCAGEGPKNDFAPEGSLDVVECSSAAGWVLDRDAMNVSTGYHIYIDGSAPYGGETTELRSDVQAAFASAGASADAKHGFTFTIPEGHRGEGAHRLELYALDYISTGAYSGGTKNTFIGAKEYSCNSAGGVPGVSKHQPNGYIDSQNICKSIVGWALDQDIPATAITYHIYLDDVMIDFKTTDKLREDVNNFYPGVTGQHGFEYSMAERNLTGVHTINIYAIDYDNQGNFGDSSKNVWIGGGSVDCGDIPGSAPRTNAWAPTGVVDDNSCKLIRGWAFDPDSQARSIQVHIYIDGEGTPVNTTMPRDDVNAAHQITGTHGFQFNPDQKYWDSQIHTALVYAIDVDSAGVTVNGTNTLIANVNWACDAQGNEIKIVPPPTTPPGGTGGGGNKPIGGTISFPWYCPGVGESVETQFAAITKVGDGHTTSGQAVRDLQVCLNDMGFDAGPVDGAWGPRTRSALVAFVRVRQLDLARLGRPVEIGSELTSEDQVYAGENIYSMIYTAALEGYLNPSRNAAGAVNTRGNTTVNTGILIFDRSRLTALGYPQDGLDSTIIGCFQNEWSLTSGRGIGSGNRHQQYDRDTDSALAEAENATDQFGEKWMHSPYRYPCYDTSEGGSRPTGTPSRLLNVNSVRNGAIFNSAPYVSRINGVSENDFEGIISVVDSYLSDFYDSSNPTPPYRATAELVEQNDMRWWKFPDESVVRIRDTRSWHALKQTAIGIMRSFSQLPLNQYGRTTFFKLYFAWETPGYGGWFAGSPCSCMTIPIKPTTNDSNIVNAGAFNWLVDNIGIHELGHAYHHNYNGLSPLFTRQNPGAFAYKNVDIFQWFTYTELEGVRYNFSGINHIRGFPSEYGSTSHAEDFAEYFTGYYSRVGHNQLQARSDMDPLMTLKGIIVEDILLR